MVAQHFTQLHFFSKLVFVSARPTLIARRGCAPLGPVEAVGRGVAQIAPELVIHAVDDMGIGGEPAHQKSALDAGRDLHGDVARALVAYLELPALCPVADDVLKPVEMHLGELVQGALHGRGNGTEDRTERATRTHTLALAVDDTEHVEIALEPHARLFAVNFRQLRPHPVPRAFEYREGDGVLRVEMVVETRFADADFISNVLEAETVKASRLNQALSAVEDFFPGVPRGLLPAA